MSNPEWGLPQPEWRGSTTRQLVRMQLNISHEMRGSREQVEERLEQLKAETEMMGRTLAAAGEDVTLSYEIVELEDD